MPESLPEREDLDRIFAQLEDENDRAAIIVSGVLLETGLETMLSLHLRDPASKTEATYLFGDNGIATSFSQKIWLAYFMKLIGPSTKRDLDLIRLIRNEAAHRLAPVSFSSSAIGNRCREIQITRTI